MAEDNYKPMPEELEIAERLKESGQTYTAEYVKMFGIRQLCPWFFNANSVQEKEKFYKKCVEEGKPWTEYQDEPDWSKVVL